MPVSILWLREGDAPERGAEAIEQLGDRAEGVLFLGRIGVAAIVCALAKRRRIASLLASSWSLHPDTVSLFRETAEAGLIGEASIHIGTVKAREAVEFADAVLPKGFRMHRTRSHMKAVVVTFADGGKLAFHGSANLRDDTDAQHCFATTRPEVVAAVEAALVAVKEAPDDAPDAPKQLEMDWL